MKKDSGAWSLLPMFIWHLELKFQKEENRGWGGVVVIPHPYYYTPNGIGRGIKSRNVINSIGSWPEFWCKVSDSTQGFVQIRVQTVNTHSVLCPGGQVGAVGGALKHSESSLSQFHPVHTWGKNCISTTLKLFALYFRPGIG